MKVFISWSGERSREVAAFLYEWLPCVIQATNPWMSSKDIDKGSIWFNEINDELKDTAVGIICVTNDNKNKPWILFEAGALLKGLTSNRVIPLLIDLEVKDIESPLSQFNATLPSKEGILGLVKTINNEVETNRLTDNILENIFNTFWGQFENRFHEILHNTESENIVEKRSDDEILSEILTTTRSLDKKLRSIENIGQYKTTNTSNFKAVSLKDEIYELINSGYTKEEIFNALDSKWLLTKEQFDYLFISAAEKFRTGVLEKK
ncbi:TIR domain-containing protein [Chengkuizengella sp. SCS-71B]|uniref:TIR domain-containing protein n=1 Tax=Chengkuizengella sp. SCS-71B TaxID=3115290 RepID=UPI0032C2205A